MCYATKSAWITKSKPRRIVFRYPNNIENYVYIETNCGKCAECRKQQARDWKIRIVHEAEINEENCFLTLTYNEEKLPSTLQKRDMQLFFKKLRKEIYPEKLRYFYCGEYGSLNCRPHYHAIIFGQDFRSEKWIGKIDLEKLWGKGFIDLGSVTEESAAYVAGYVQKKLDKKEKDYLNIQTGELLQTEFVQASTGRGEDRGIGYRWIRKNLTDTYKDDTIRLGSNVSKPPRYYDKVLCNEDTKIHNTEINADKIKDRRIEETAKKGVRSEQKNKARIEIEKARPKKKRRYENV